MSSIHRIPAQAGPRDREALPSRRDLRHPAVSQPPGMFQSWRPLLALAIASLTVSALLAGAGVLAGYLIWGIR